MKHYRRNPDILQNVIADVLPLALVGGLALYLLGQLKLPGTPGGPGLPGLPTINPTPGFPGLNIPPGNWWQYGSTGTAPTTSSTQYVDLTSDAILNPYIDSWFSQAGGLFGTGIGGYDPTNWTGFIQWMTVQHFAQNGNYSTGLFANTAPLPVFPSSPTAYFNAKSQAYWGSNPYASPTSGQFS